MSFLRIGTTCVVINERNEVLLSQRGDLKTWNLPGGRLDKGETLEAAAREVREETGIEVEIERPVGLYYTTRWQRLNVLVRARPVGGALLGRTHETLDNRWFRANALPENVFRSDSAADALSAEAVLRVIDTRGSEYLRLRWKFGWRWVRNLLSGRPEPRYLRFNVWAVATVSNREVCRVPCNGMRAPWRDLEAALEDCGQRNLCFKWTGVRQDVAGAMIEFIFSSRETDANLGGQRA